MQSKFYIKLESPESYESKGYTKFCHYELYLLAYKYQSFLEISTVDSKYSSEGIWLRKKVDLKYSRYTLDNALDQYRHICLAPDLVLFNSKLLTDQELLTQVVNEIDYELHNN